MLKYSWRFHVSLHKETIRIATRRKQKDCISSETFKLFDVRRDLKLMKDVSAENRKQFYYLC